MDKDSKNSFDFNTFGIDADDIRDEANNHADDNYQQTESGFFISKPMNEWMKIAESEPIPNMLLGEFWFEREVNILFSDTNLGKSTLAYQTAEAISRGTKIMNLRNEAPAQKVLYFDFELSKKLLHARYSDNYKNPYQWSSNFMRIERNPDSVLLDDINAEEKLNDLFRKEIEVSGAKVVIVDNITALRSDIEKAKEAIPFMTYLRGLKNAYGLSILVIAHTPKRDLSMPITENDMAGSKQLLNLADNAFAIGRSYQDENLRYLKQIKPKLTACLYGSDNVLTCSITKIENFQGFEFKAFDKENYHLKPRSEKEDLDLLSKIYQLHDEGKSIREIAEIIGISKSMVERRLDKRKRNNQKTDSNDAS